MTTETLQTTENENPFVFTEPEEKKKRGRPSKTEKSKVKLGKAQPSDNVIYFDEADANISSEEPLAFNHEVDHSLLEFRFFRNDERHKLKGNQRAGYWQPARIDTVLLGVALADVFVGEGDPSYPWDTKGRYPRGEALTVSGEERELYLAVRPAAATIPEQIHRAKVSAKSGSDLDPEFRKSLANLNLTTSDGEQVLKTAPIDAATPYKAVTSAGWTTPKKP